MMTDSLKPFMFTKENMVNMTHTISVIPLKQTPLPKPLPAAKAPEEPKALAEPKAPPPPPPMSLAFARDQLFIHFYQLVPTINEPIDKANWFTLEKQFKIQTVERLGEVKEALKVQKLKLPAIEDELVTQPFIGLTGLYALCLVHQVSLLYVKGRTYFAVGDVGDPLTVPVFVVNSNNSADITVHHNDAALINDIYANYWPLEGLQKQIRSPSAYTLAELQEIARRLQIAGVDPLTNKGRTKPVLYTLILEKLDY